MTTVYEEVVLIDFLWNHASIGCDGSDERSAHLPELCVQEREDYWRWETELRAMGGAAEDAYQLIRDVAKAEWQCRYGEHWHGSRLLEARVIEMLRMTAEKRMTWPSSLVREEGIRGRKDRTRS